MHVEIIIVIWNTENTYILVVPVLPTAGSHEKMALRCGLFGLGLGATMVTGNTTMYNALGSWNFAKVDIILDFFSGVLVLVAGSAMSKSPFMKVMLKGIYTISFNVRIHTVSINVLYAFVHIYVDVCVYVTVCLVNAHVCAYGQSITSHKT